MAQRSSSHRRIVGVTIDGDVLRGVEIRRGLRSMQATAVAEVPMPTAPIDAPDDFDGLAEGLRELWSAGGFSTKNVAFGINGRDAVMRPMSVPPPATTDIAGYVRYQLADYLSFELDEAVIDHQVVEEAEDGVVDVLAIGVPVELVERIGHSVAGAGLRLVSVDATPTALATAIDPAGAAEDADAVVSVDATRTTVVLRSAGRPRVVRVLAAGGGDRTAQLADELEGMIARVEGHQSGGADTPVVVGQDRRFAEAADAVAAAINYDLREHSGTGVDHVVVTGAFGRYESLHHLMANAAGTSVAAAMPPTWWPHGQDDDFDDFDHYVEAAGLAFAYLDGRDDSFDLMPPTVREANDDRRELTFGVGVAGVVAAVSMFALLPYRAGTQNAQDEVEALEADVGLLSSRAEGLALIGELDQSRLAQIDSIASALRDDLWWGRILESIANATGDDTYLTSMTLVRPVGNDDENAIVAFNGAGADQAAVGTWLDRMGQLGIFEDIWLVQSTAAVLGDNDDAAVVFLAQARLTADARGPRSVDPTTWLDADTDLDQAEAALEETP